MKNRLLVLSGLTLLAAACDTVIGPRADTRVIGIIEWQGTATAGAATAAEVDDVVISAPDTVDAGVPFPVTITTFGLSGCWNADGASIHSQPRLITVTPWDRVFTHADGQPAFCTAALTTLSRQLELVFNSTGVATLRVNGRIAIGGDPLDTRPGVIEKAIVVR